MTTLLSRSVRAMLGATTTLMLSISAVSLAFSQETPRELQIAALHGDPGAPNADVFFRVPARYDLPAHWHTSRNAWVLVSGELHVGYDGQKPVVLTPACTRTAPRRRCTAGVAPATSPACSSSRSSARSMPPGCGSPLMEQQIRFCTTSDGVRLAYAVLGSGPPLIVASGWLTHLQFDWDNPEVSAFWKGLARGRRLIRYDKRGTGLSDRNVADLSFESRVEDLRAVAGALELDRFDLLGISEGGATALSFAARHPERVASLMLYGTYPRLPFRRDLVDVFLRALRTEWGVGSAAFTAFVVPGDAGKTAWFNEYMRASSSREERGADPRRPSRST